MKYTLCHELGSGKHFPMKFSLDSKKCKISLKEFYATDIEDPYIPWLPLSIIRAYMKRDKYPKRKKIYSK